MGSTTRKSFQPVPADVERVGRVGLDAAYAVHTELGPGLLESVYQVAMKHVIELDDVLVETEVKPPILYRGVKLESGLRLDMLVNQSAIVELKSVEKKNPVYEAPLLTSLRLSNVHLGFLINFHVPHLKDGIKRMVV
jgi:GxxExxY protein